MKITTCVKLSIPVADGVYSTLQRHSSQLSNHYVSDAPNVMSWCADGVSGTRPRLPCAGGMGGEMCQ
jgi:hypothetical protein